MDSKKLHKILLGYSVVICTVDQLTIQRGSFVISNMDTSQGLGEHWVTFYYTKHGPFDILLIGTYARTLRSWI